MTLQGQRNLRRRQLSGDGYRRAHSHQDTHTDVGRTDGPIDRPVYQAIKRGCGHTRLSLVHLICRWRWGPVERPVLPDFMTNAPAAIACPRFTVTASP